MDPDVMSHFVDNKAELDGLRARLKDAGLKGYSGLFMAEYPLEYSYEDIYNRMAGRVNDRAFVDKFRALVEKLSTKRK